MPPPDSPSPSDPGSGGGSGASRPREPDPLEELSRRVRAAQEAADRVIAQAGAATTRAGATTGDRPPARGYAGPRDDERDDRSAEARALQGLLDLGRGLMPAELRHAMADLVRELLLLLRALIDWYLERLELRRREPVEVEDIPIT